MALPNLKIGPSPKWARPKMGLPKFGQTAQRYQSKSTAQKPTHGAKQAPTSRSLREPASGKYHRNGRPQRSALPTKSPALRKKHAAAAAKHSDPRWTTS